MNSSKAVSSNMNRTLTYKLSFNKTPQTHRQLTTYATYLQSNDNLHDFAAFALIQKSIGVVVTPKNITYVNNRIISKLQYPNAIKLLMWIIPRKIVINSITPNFKLVHRMRDFLSCFVDCPTIRAKLNRHINSNLLIWMQVLRTQRRKFNPCIEPYECRKRNAEILQNRSVRVTNRVFRDWKLCFTSLLNTKPDFLICVVSLHRDEALIPEACFASHRF